jgi:hypothetical protein
MSRLDGAMNQLAAELGEAPRGLESALLAEFDRVNRGRRIARWTAAVTALAASVFVLVVTIEHRRPTPQPAAPVAAAQAPVQASAQPADSDQPFVPIPYVLPPAPYERVEVVRMQVPVAALVAAGFRLQNADQGAQAEADVIVGQDGRARAVRLISISSVN